MMPGCADFTGTRDAGQIRWQPAEVTSPHAGVITFMTLPIHQHGSVAPDWPTGIALGIGGLAGGYTGARLQSRLPELLIRRLVGILIIAIGLRYLIPGLS